MKTHKRRYSATISAGNLLFPVASYPTHLIRAPFKTRHDFCRSLKRHYHRRRAGEVRIWHNVSPGHRRNVLFIAMTAYVLSTPPTIRRLSPILSPAMHSNAPLTPTLAFCYYSCIFRCSGRHLFTRFLFIRVTLALASPD